MKKIISLVLMLVMMFSVSAFAEDEFSLHSGVKFGMTFEEVKALEKEAGFATESHEEWNYLVAKGTIAGQKDSNVYYFFYDNKSLNWMEYSFEGDVFQIMESSLENKYGSTEYSSMSGLFLPKFTVTGHEFTDFSVGNTVYGNLVNETTLTCDYSQRIIPISDTEYVYIECKHTIILFDGHDIKNPYTVEQTNVHYVLLDAATVDKIYSDMEQLDSDL